MERKIGEIFEYEGRKLQVVENGGGCKGCYFCYKKSKYCLVDDKDKVGLCCERSDQKEVIFKKVK